MAQPLEGIRILELGNLIAGPFCSMILGDMGADVIKIERPPHGDVSRSMSPLVKGESGSFAALNRNKRSIVLDLKQPQARDVAVALIKKSHAFVENNRPGALAGIGLGPEQVRAINPEIIYVSASGFGQTGPWRQRAGINLIIDAFSGSLSVTGSPDDMPMRTGLQTTDIFGGLFAAYAVLSGLIGVLRGGSGQVADISLAESSIAAAVWETAAYLATGEVPQRLGHQHRQTVPYQVFETSDAKFVALGTPNQELFVRFMKVAGLEAHAGDARFASGTLRKANGAALLAIVAPAVRARKAADWEAELAKVGVPCSIVNDYGEVFNHPHIRERNVVAQVDHPRAGTMRAVRNPVLFAHDGPTIRRHPPMLGEHTREVLRELGHSDATIDEWAKAGVVQENRD